VQRLYSEDHYYLIHVDPGGSTLEFEKDMHKLADSMPRRNVFIVRDVPIVYGAATATIVLVKAMAWYLRHASSWDYFVPVTGADYPLVPLKRY
jgi:dihydroxyacetone kinase DhaKLM complex PTS-EIIA-like component DhaM